MQMYFKESDLYMLQARVSMKKRKLDACKRHSQTTGSRRMMSRARAANAAVSG